MNNSDSEKVLLNTVKKIIDTFLNIKIEYFHYIHNEILCDLKDKIEKSKSSFYKRYSHKNNDYYLDKLIQEEIEILNAYYPEIFHDIKIHNFPDDFIRDVIDSYNLFDTLKKDYLKNENK